MFFNLVEEYWKRKIGNIKTKKRKQKAKAMVFENGCAPCNACVLQGAQLFFVAEVSFLCLRDMNGEAFTENQPIEHACHGEADWECTPDAHDAMFHHYA